MACRSGSTTSLEKSGGSIRRRSSAKDRKSVDAGVAKPAANTKLIEAEKSETGKVIFFLLSTIFFRVGCDVLLLLCHICFNFYSGQFQSIWALFAIHWCLAFHLDFMSLHHLSSNFAFSISIPFFHNLFSVLQGFAVYSNVWLAKWSEAGNTTNAERDLYLGVYGALGFGQGSLPINYFFLSLLVYNC